MPACSNPKPTLIAGGLSWRQVRPGAGIDNGINSIEIDDGVGCGVTQDDRAYCWGLGAIGRDDQADEHAECWWPAGAATARCSPGLPTPAG